jgi:hypothetical protein
VKDETEQPGPEIPPIESPIQQPEIEVVAGPMKRLSPKRMDDLVRKHGNRSSRIRIMRMAGELRIFPFVFRRKRVFVIFERLDLSELDEVGNPVIRPSEEIASASHGSDDPLGAESTNIHHMPSDTATHTKGVEENSDHTSPGKEG